MITHPQKVTETLEVNYMPYAMSVIISRAIPEIDGLKPSHRKILYTMFKMGLLRGAKTKSANVVGQTMRLNPHGDMAIYETLVRMTTGSEALLLPVIESKGNFGKIYSRDMAFAAPRYTEVKLASVAAELFESLDKDAVDFIDNYDGTMKEPVMLPVSFPNLLVNANTGIAVGMASNFCSFNLREVCDVTIAYIDNPDCDLLEILKAPDFPTGGRLIFKEEDIRTVYETGRGSFKMRANYRYDKKNNCIEIYEIPYTTTTELVIDKIVELIKQNKIKKISDVRDETDLKGLKVTIDLSRGADVDQIMSRLFRFTPLEDTFSCNFNLLVKGRPVVLGIKKILDAWLAFRIGCVKRRTAYELMKKTDKLHLLIGLQKILLDIDLAIKIIRETEKEADVLPNLMTGFSIDEIQAEYICDIRLRNLNKEYILKRTSEIESLKKEIEDLERILKSRSRITTIIKKQLKEVAKTYGIERKTDIVTDDDVLSFTPDNMVEDYNCKFFLTDHGYLKKIPLVSLRSNPEHKTKDDDKIICEVDGSNKCDLLFFTDRQNCFKCKAWQIDPCKASQLGLYLQNYLDMEDGEEILYVVASDDYSGHMMFGFENGKIAKIPLKSYETKTNRKLLSKAYSGTSGLVAICFLEQDKELVAFSNRAKALIFNTADVNSKNTRSSGGVTVLKSSKGSKMKKITGIEDASLGDDLDYYRTKNIPAVGNVYKQPTLF